jgi:putative ABC transport system permease protein
LIGEGAVLGAVGALIGVLLGVLFAAALLHALTGDLGNGQLRSAGALHTSAWPLLFFFFVGTAVSSAGAWLPARSAARHPPARALKGGDGDYGAIARPSWRAGIVLLLVGALCARLPAVGGLPLFGYAAIAALLFGAVLLVPVLTVKILSVAPRTNRVVWDAAIAQLRENVGLSALSLASIIVSFSLMVAMAIMVHSFRNSFELWLVKLLPADMQLRLSSASDTGAFSADQQAQMAALPGVARAQFRRVREIWLRADRPPVTLIARDIDPAHAADTLPLVRDMAQAAPSGTLPAWISEALQDQYAVKAGDRLLLPLDGRLQPLFVAGVWRDYARGSGAIVIARAAYIALSADVSANEGSLWRRPAVSAAALEQQVRAALQLGDALELVGSEQVRERALMLFDRAFAITYALEGIAVAIGLVGVGVAASASAVARRAQFGMLRHIGMLRRQVLAMLAIEGVIMSSLSAVYGLLLGFGLSLILVYVINRQSFNWSIDLAVPWGQLGVLSSALVAAAALTALWSGRAATGQDAIRAVREDW